jgi:polyisoprenoid-binding protein YceI
MLTNCSKSANLFRKEADVGSRKLGLARLRRLAPIIPVLAAIAAFAQTPEVALEFVPARTTIAFTLGDTLHTVHGAFALKSGKVTYNRSTGEVSGEVIADATSGHTGNGMRDRKMHKEILQSAKYPEIIFRPDHVEGKVAQEGVSTVQVHGVFSIHGSDHEMTLPTQVEMAPDHWTATAHFVVPYAKWGIKNPSTLLLRVSESVEIDVHASGQNTKLPAIEQ